MTFAKDQTMQDKQFMYSRTAYSHGQLLGEQNFIDEQALHMRGRWQHNRVLHGFGIVEGLQLAADNGIVTVSPGVAIDRRGRELVLRETEAIEYRGAANGPLVACLALHKERPAGSERIDCFAAVRLVPAADVGNDVRLGTVRFDGKGLTADLQPRDILERLEPGSVTAAALHEQLRVGWMTMAFHPTPLPNDEKGWRPPFRVGASRALAHEEYKDRKPNKDGAAGTMAVVLPPGIRQLLGFRVAGEFNSGTLTAELIRGGFAYDGKSLATARHLREVVTTLTSTKQQPYFMQALDIPAAHRDLNDELRTLAVDIRATDYASVSLVAVKVSY